MDLGFFNKYPYTDFHELNLDWLIAALKAYAKELQEFVQINAIKYADPLQWDITRQYEKNTVVIDPLTGTAYISVQPVPAGISLARPEYWTVVFDLSVFITAANNNFTVRVETTTTTTATFNTAAGEWLIWDQKLYKADVNITAGDAYVENSNITRWTVEDGLQVIASDLSALAANVGDLNDLTTSDKTSIVNAINDVVSALATVVNNVGDLTSLTTTDKTSIVAAINEIVTNLGTITGSITTLSGNVGALADLTTTDKTSIVNAINELVTNLGTLGGSLTALAGNVGALADLTTTDKTSIVNAINELVSSIGTISGNIGDLADLHTSDKTSVVNAINEIVDGGALNAAYVTPEQFGAVGDGVTDDTAAIQAAANDGRKIILGAGKTYKVTNLYLNSQLFEGNNTTIDISGSITKTTLSDKLTFNRVRFVTTGNNPLFTGYTSWLYCVQCDFNDFNDVMLESSGTFVGFSTFIECFFNRGNHVMSASVSINAVTFYKCSFSEIAATAFRSARYEGLNFDSCTYANCSNFLGSYDTTVCRLDGVNFTSCYLETGTILDDQVSYNGNPGYYQGTINFFGGFYNTDQMFINIQSASSTFTLMIKGMMFYQFETGAINLTDKVWGEIEQIGAINQTKVTGETLNMIQTYENVEHNSCSIESPSFIPTDDDITAGTVGRLAVWNMATWGCGSKYVFLAPHINENSLTALKNLTDLPYWCFGFDKTSHKTYFKYNNNWYDMDGNSV